MRAVMSAPSAPGAGCGCRSRQRRRPITVSTRAPATEQPGVPDVVGWACWRNEIEALLERVD